jgi:hypothetical protein
MDVATGRNPDAVGKALGEADNLLVVKLEVTSCAEAEAAVWAAVGASTASACWSTTPPTFMRATSRS